MVFIWISGIVLHDFLLHRIDHLIKLLAELKSRLKVVPLLSNLCLLSQKVKVDHSQVCLITLDTKFIFLEQVCAHFFKLLQIKTGKILELINMPSYLVQTVRSVAELSGLVIDRIHIHSHATLTQPYSLLTAHRGRPSSITGVLLHLMI